MLAVPRKGSMYSLQRMYQGTYPPRSGLWVGGVLIVFGFGGSTNT